MKVVGSSTPVIPTRKRREVSDVSRSLSSEGLGPEQGPRPGPRLCAERAAGVCGQRPGHRVGAASPEGRAPEAAPRSWPAHRGTVICLFPSVTSRAQCSVSEMCFLSFSNDSRNQHTELSSACSKDGSLFFLSSRIGKQASRLRAAPRVLPRWVGGPLQLQLCALFISLVLELSLQVSFPET